MSFSMFLGRVLLPGCTLAIAGLLAYQAIKTGRVDLSTLSLRSLAAAPESEAPAASLPAREEAVRVIAEGRVVAYPGAQVVVGSAVAGTIENVLVHERSVVHKGDVLIEFASRDIGAQVAEADARLAEAESEVSRVELDADRVETLVKQKAAPRQDVERLGFNLRSARARRDAVKAARDRLQSMLQKYRVVAPIDGVVTSRFAQPGETVAIAAPLITIVDLSRLRIEAEVDEYDIARVAVGGRVKITAEGYPGKSWRGEVEELADVLVGRRIRPEDPGRPTDTRVLPVRIAFRVETPLRFGQRVEVEITGRQDRNASSTDQVYQTAVGAEASGPS
jgi:RND family efflux transporter MFP subunit